MEYLIKPPPFLAGKNTRCTLPVQQHDTCQVQTDVCTKKKKNIYTYIYELGSLIC